VGKSQSGPDSVEVKYYVYAAGWHLVPCAYAAESHLRELRFNDQLAYSGDASGVTGIYINKPDLFGGIKREGGVVGTFTYMAGAPTQTPNAYLQGKMGTSVPAFRGVISLVAERPELQTNNPFLKPPSMQIACYHGTWYAGKSKITASKTVYTTTQVPVDPDPEEEDDLSCDWYSFCLGICEIQGLDSPGITDPELVPSAPWDGDGFIMDGWVDTNPTPWDESTPSQAYDWVYVGNEGAEETKTYVNVTTSEVVVYEIGQNPAHIIREVAVNKEWGRGIPDIELNDATFVAAADTLYNEGFGISISWDAQVSVDAFLQLIVDHIGGNFARNPVTNEYELRLFRPGQAVDHEISEDQIVRFESYEETGWADTINEITVVYVDFEDGKEKSVTVQDLAAIERAGRVISETRTYRGLPTLQLAEKVARRDLAASVIRMQKAELVVDRSLFSIMEGHVVSITWPDYELDGLQLRVITVDHGTAQDNEIYFTAISDINLEQLYPTLAEDPPLPPSSALEPFNVSPRGMLEAPYWYYDRVRTALGFFPDGLADDESALMAFGGSPQSNATGFLTNLSINDEGYLIGTAGSFCGVLQSLGGLTSTTTTILLDRTYQKNLDAFVSGVPLILGRSELAQMVSLDIQNWSMVVNRGLLDTVPQTFLDRVSIETIAYADNGYFSHIVGLGDDVTVKLQTKTSKGILALADASEMTRIVAGRQARPLPPGNLSVNGGYLSQQINNETLFVEWKHRNRLTQTTDAQILQSDDNVAPEANTNYVLKVYDDSGALAVNETISSADTPQFIYDTEVATLGQLQGKLKVELESERDGLVSYTKWSHELVRAVEILSNVGSNYDFAGGTLTAWNNAHGLPEPVAVGALGVTNPTGSGYVAGNNPASTTGQWSLYQTIDFSSEGVSAAAIAYGTFGVVLTVTHRQVTGQTIGTLSVALYDSGGTLLRRVETEQFYFSSSVWGTKNLVVPSVAGAVTAVVGVKCYGVGGPNGGYVGKIEAGLVGRFSESGGGGGGDYYETAELMNPYYWVRFDKQDDLTLNGTEITAAGLTQAHSFSAPVAGGPTLLPQTLGGRSVARFAQSLNLQAASGHDQLLGVDGITMMAVYKSTKAALTSGVINISVGSGGSIVNSRAAMFIQNIGIQRVGGRRLDGDSFVASELSGATFEDWNLGFGMLDYSNRKLYNSVNGGAAAVLNDFQTYGVTETSPTQVGLGGYPEDTTEHFFGDIAEILILPKLSTVERWIMEGYLAHKWGLTDKLPSDHLYKNVAPIHHGTDPLWEDVVALYRFGDWNDWTENRYDLTPVGSVVPDGAEILSTFGTALEITASGAYAENTSVPGPGAQDFTFEGLVYVSSSVGNQNSWIFRIGAAGLYHDYTDNRLYFFDGVVSATCYAPGLTRDAAHHFAVARNAGFVTVFVDGVPGTPVEITRDLSAAGLRLGSLAGSGINGMVGKIDIFRYTLGVARYAGTYAVPTAHPPGLPVRPESQQEQGSVIVDLEM
jgi:hypothetical protein